MWHLKLKGGLGLSEAEAKKLKEENATLKTEPAQLKKENQEVIDVNNGSQINSGMAL